MRYAIPILLSLAAATKAYFPLPFYSAASDAQIRFALENKYDDTGPGAKAPEYAYNVYRTLDEAILGYLDDPDTKLPEQDKERALSTLAKKPGYIEYKPYNINQEFKRYYPKSVEEYTGYTQQKQQEQGELSSRPKPGDIYKGYRLPQPQLVLTKLRTNPPKKYYHQVQSNEFFKSEEGREVAEPYRIDAVKPFRASSLAPSHYRDPDLQDARDQYDPHPKYTYSYGVHVPDTGDTKSAKETREGGTVRGYYSFADPDGKQRTVHYTADDKHGFQATVERE